MAGLLEKIESHNHAVPHGDRSERRHRALADGSMVCRCRRRLPRPRSRPCGRDARGSSPNNMRRPITTGWRTSSRGASRANCGGDIRSPPGTGRMVQVFVEETLEAAQTAADLHYGRTVDADAATKMCSTPGSRRRSGRSRRSAGPATRQGRRPLLPDQRAGDGLRHHLLLGRADDDDGPALHRRRAVP